MSLYVKGLVQGKQKYVAESQDRKSYILTDDKNKARDFRWANIWFGRKIVLAGIRSKFNSSFDFVKEDK